MEQPTVVVLDDDPDTLYAYGVVFERAGYKVRSAATGQQFLALLGAAVPSAIVMDLGLPDARGVTLCRTIRAARRFAAVPVIAVTGWSSGPNVDGVGDAPFNEVFLKPVDPDLLVAALRRWVTAPLRTPDAAPALPSSTATDPLVDRPQV